VKGISKLALSAIDEKKAIRKLRVHLVFYGQMKDDAAFFVHKSHKVVTILHLLPRALCELFRNIFEHL
jgi:hypothetical protein